eukprot:5032405-Prymnesium_polylepis.1
MHHAPKRCRWSLQELNPIKRMVQSTKVAPAHSKPQTLPMVAPRADPDQQAHGQSHTKAPRTSNAADGRSKS